MGDCAGNQECRSGLGCLGFLVWDRAVRAGRDTEGQVWGPGSWALRGRPPGERGLCLLSECARNMDGQDVLEGFLFSCEKSLNNGDFKMSEIFKCIRLFSCIRPLTCQNLIFLESIREGGPRHS